MKNKVLNSIIVVLTLVVTITNLVFTIINNFDADIEELPEGELIQSVSSKDETRTVNIYKVEIPSLGTGIRGELVSTASGTTIKRNIYWEVNQSSVTVIWIDDKNIKIGEQTLNVLYDTYDCRKEIDIPDVPATTKGLV